ncbi:MMPL family transporter [Vibrio breoganii]|uniref:MMPL family transporter n=1 Tax=Vibrio breoganii TaxID=553239 RepID=UPI000C81FF51|nr:MMPL family transporter [Vibrio breoganii]PMG93277.1 hypothetical protein BCU80_08575 [Vibrio breoganii]PMK38989.1 hypothetical protein BCU00_17335 [Vibrio breoganii]PMO64318.1 hypothetical protein BCT04_13955 [Vibrio breoganii]
MLSKRNSASSNSSGNIVTSKKLALAWLSLVLLFIAMLAKQWLWATQSPVETNILKLLPKNQQDPVAELAFGAVSQDLSDKLVFLVTADSDENILAAANLLEESLLNTGLFHSVAGKVDTEKQNEWATFYFNNRFHQLTSEQRERLINAPSSQVQLVVQALYNPFSGVTGNELSNDPFLLFRDYLSQLTRQHSTFELERGYLSTQYAGKKYVLVSATLKDSPYSLKAQQGVKEINSIEQTLSETYQASTYHTGVLFYAAFGTESAKSEISTIGLFSLLGVVILIVGVFRSATPLALAVLSITVGLLSALALTTWIFGQVHLFSLVFGASLIGVSIDYAFHYLTERLWAGEKWDSQAGLKHIFIAITMGLITSLIGYLGMLIAPFPGLQQLALFSSIGLIAAYTTVVAWYPVLAVAPSKSRILPGQAMLTQWLALWSKKWIKMGLPIACLIMAAIPLANVHYDDDIRQLQTMPNSLKQQEQLITEVSGIQSSQQMLVVTAQDDEALLLRLESLQLELNDWQKTGVLKGYQSLTQYISSSALQKENFDLITALYKQQGDLLTRTLKLTDAPTLDQPFSNITLQSYLKETVSEPVRFLYIGQYEDRVASVILLNELSAPEKIRAFSDDHADISYLDKAEEISSLFSTYRIKVMELLIVALSVITLLLIKRYGLKHAFMVLVPSLIACVVGLAAASAIGSALNLFNLLALILIIGIGIDYTLFFAEKARSSSTLLAITLSAITTLLAFGLLSLSQTHAIHSFGTTVLSGIFVAWLLAPLAIKE